ncbi:MAG: fumarate hydratase [Leptospirales bacterium]|nr:fumarate hydratase [Leptospirales bacterium]
MRKINTSKIAEAVKEMIFESSFRMPRELAAKFDDLIAAETNQLAAETLAVLKENGRIAETERLPLCQDCGSVIIFLEIGQDAALTGDSLTTALNSAVAQAYDEFYLRKSIVADPLRRTNTGTNTPASIHTEIAEGDSVRVRVYLKGGGSENMSSLKMFNPTTKPEAIIDYIEETVIAAGPNPCPPVFLGVGIGGSADTALKNAKTAIFRGIDSRHPDPFYAEMEEKITDRLNKSGVGVMGFGGRSTAAGVYIKEAPAHIASLPVALNMNCHSLRYGTREL